jgi:DNA polymerase family A
MNHVPGIEGLHALRDSLGVIKRAKLPIGPDGRNRPSLFPFGTATGRNAHSKSLFNAHASVRSFMVFPEDKIGVYLDWRTQEVGVAAALSDDQALMDAYRNGDVYHALARVCGLTDDPDAKRWKTQKPMERQQMKALQLAINYGMGVPSLAKGLDRHPLIASGIIERHRQTYPRFWQWRDLDATHPLRCHGTTAPCNHCARGPARNLHTVEQVPAAAEQYPDWLAIVASATISHSFTILGHKIGVRNMWRIGRRGPAIPQQEVQMSILGKLREARAELETQGQDPWREKVEAAVREKDAISTAALLDLLRAPATTGTARRLAAVMRSLQFIPIKSRRLMPGGRAGNTVTRGWARPVRAIKSSPTTTRAGGTGVNLQGMIP